jgi:F-type H+-transporting ATPase subunit c
METSAAKLIAAGLAVIGLFGVGIGIGNIFSSFITAVARNPSAKQELTAPLYVGAAFTEAVGFLAFTVAMLVLFVF